MNNDNDNDNDKIPHTLLSSTTFARMVGERVAAKIADAVADSLMKPGVIDSESFDEYTRRAMVYATKEGRTSATDDAAGDIMLYLGQKLLAEMEEDGDDIPDPAKAPQR